ncbi:kinase-like domain-containing protein [Mycena epipterygia]|nr:kinase-like domain-containing protein [Mycena epipterygia]
MMAPYPCWLATMCYPHIMNVLSGRASAAPTARYLPLLPLHRDANTTDVRSQTPPRSVAARVVPSFIGKLWNGVLGSCFSRRPHKVLAPHTTSTEYAPISIDGTHRKLLCSQDFDCSFDKTSGDGIVHSNLCNNAAPGYLLSSQSSRASTDSFLEYYTSEDPLKSFDTDEVPPLRYNGAEFVLRARLGGGATSHIMLARALWPGASEMQDVAIKVINKEQVSLRRSRQHGQWTTTVATPETIKSEIAILKRFMDPALLTPSPFLTPLLAAFQDEANVYLVMRMYPETLARRMRCLAAEGKKLSVRDIRLYAAELLCALKALHQDHHTVHCDLKSQNILISPSGHLCLSDFGLANHHSENRGIELCMVRKAGTVPYLAPEVFTSRKTFVGTTSDIWAFGMLLLEMFEGTGQPHFSTAERDCEVNAVSNVDALVEDPDAAQLIDLIMKERPKLPDIQAHAFFSMIEWDQVEGREYSPSYRPGVPPICGGPSVAFSTCLTSASGADVQEISANAWDELDSLDIDYMCPSPMRFDPLH